jgi:hypothetical protein
MSLQRQKRCGLYYYNSKQRTYMEEHNGNPDKAEKSPKIDNNASRKDIAE